MLDMVKKVANDRKHANDVVQLLSLMEKPDEKVVRIVVDGLCRFFAKALVDKGNTKGKDTSTETQLFMDWTDSRYSEFQSNLAKLLDSSLPDFRKLAFFSIIHMAEMEIICLSAPQASHVPETLIKMLLDGLICSQQPASLGDELRKAFRLVDLRYYLLKFLSKITAKCLKEHPKQIVIQNTFFILEAASISFTSDDKTSSESSGLSLFQGNVKDVFPEFGNEDRTVAAIPAEACASVKVFDVKESKKVFSTAWMDILGLNLDQHTIKLILCLMEKHIIPNFSSPCVLADFLTNCFGKGGGIALLSLHGLFMLMTEHNLDYPKFYDHLYSIVHPRIFDAKYQSRFFYLLDIFLSSTHLPVYLVAAFAKKLSRLLLVAPTYAQPLLVNFILTLIKRHPAIQVLINRPKSQQMVDALLKGDPYVASQEDPALCKAMESSLWELTTLNHHYLPRVSQCVSELDKGPQHAINELLDETYFDIFDSLAEKEYKEAPINYIKPKCLFGGFEDATADMWQVQN